MPSFRNGLVEIAYLDEGRQQHNAEPIVLVHGFASNKEVNWVHPAWVMSLTRAGRRVIALDNRGHGRSSKLYDPAVYHSATMADDVRALLDHLDIARADIMGYSMGARISAFLAVNHPARVRSLVLGGLGVKLVEGVGLPESIAEALEARSVDDVNDPTGRLFRSFAELTKSDLKALAACLRGSRQTLTREQVGRDRRAGAGRGRYQGRGGRFCPGLSRAHPRRPSARYSRSRSYACGRRQGIQIGRQRIP